ncbi:colicin immunity protein [Pararobbsia silviterrae]|nr:colicin immunity protein [Pararobbsia silviterrae]
MRMTTQAAIAVCSEAAERGLVVARIEGGIWHNPGFEARIDCIWDSAEYPPKVDAINTNNLAAANFIHAQERDYDVFIVTTIPMIN